MESIARVFLVMVEDHNFRVTLLSLGRPSTSPGLSAGGMLLPAWHRGKDPVTSLMLVRIICWAFEQSLLHLICVGRELGLAERKTSLRGNSTEAL